MSADSVLQYLWFSNKYSSPNNWHRDSVKIARDTAGGEKLLIMSAFYIHFSNLWWNDTRSCRLITDCVNLIQKYSTRVSMQMWLCDINSALIHLPGMILSAQTSFEQQINVSYLCFHTFF